MRHVYERLTSWILDDGLEPKWFEPKWLEDKTKLMNLMMMMMMMVMMMIRVVRPGGWVGQTKTKAPTARRQSTTETPATTQAPAARTMD